MPRKKGSGGDRFCMTISKNLRAMVQCAAVERAKEGEAIGERAMLDRLLRVGAIMGMRCQGCRSGKCPKHRVGGVGSGSSPMAPTSSDAVRMEAKNAPCYTSAPTIPDKSIETAAKAHGYADEPETVVPVVRLDSETRPTALETFVLATVEPAKKPERKPRAKKAITENSPEFTRLIDVYHVEFVRVRKEKPAYTSRDFAAFRSLLKSQGFDRACELIRNAFAHIFWANRVTIRKIADNPSEFVGEVATSPRRSSGQVEPDENFFADQERRWSQETAS